MMKTKFLLILIVLVLGMAGNALVADVDWDNEAGDRLWRNPLNWDPNNVPTAADKASIRNTGDGPIIDSSTTAVAKNVPVGDWGNANTLDITGGSLTTYDWFILGYGAADEGTLNISGGATTVSGNKTDMTVGRAGIGRLNISDGSITVGDRLYVGREATGTGYINMTGGLITINDDLYTGQPGTAHITMSAGEILISSRFYLGDAADGEAYLTMTGGLIKLNDLMAVGRQGAKAEIHLDGGILDIGLHLEMSGNAAIDITGGTLIIDGDRISDGVDRSIMPFINDGRITAYGGSGGMLKIDYDITNPGKTTVTAVPADPSPADGATVYPGNVELSWMNADPNFAGGSVYVDLWFGTDPDEMSKVVTAGPDVTSKTVSAPDEPNTFYWRVDSYLYGPGHINEPNRIEGPVWSFNTSDDLPPSSVDAGIDMVTWSGQAVSLDATVVDDGASALTYAWSANPGVGVVFDPSATVENPTVTITKAPGDAATVTLTLAVHDESYDPTPVEDTMTIDVYDNACLAAQAAGLATIDPGDFDKNCITDLRDYAILAAKWLKDVSLTAPVLKP